MAFCVWPTKAARRPKKRVVAQKFERYAIDRTRISDRSTEKKLDEVNVHPVSPSNKNSTFT